MAQSSTWCQFCGAWENFHILARTHSQKMRNVWLSPLFCFSFFDISSHLSIMCPKWPWNYQALSPLLSFIFLWQKCLNNHKFTVEKSLWIQAKVYAQGQLPVWWEYICFMKKKEKEYLEMTERNKINQYLRLLLLCNH